MNIKSLIKKRVRVVRGQIVRRSVLVIGANCQRSNCPRGKLSGANWPGANSPVPEGSESRQGLCGRKLELSGHAQQLEEGHFSKMARGILYCACWVRASQRFATTPWWIVDGRPKCTPFAPMFMCHAEHVLRQSSIRSLRLRLSSLPSVHTGYGDISRQVFRY